MKKVLVIEDDVIIRENVEEILKLAQFDVYTAADGKVGCRLALDIKPDVIVSDIIMPELDGFGVLYVLSKNPDTKNIPFIFLSAKTQKADIRKGMEMGADDYLCKPFDDTELLSAIEIRLKKHDEMIAGGGKSISALDYFLDESDVDDKELYEYFENKSHSTYKKREVIYHNGDIAQYVYILKKGRVKTYKTNSEGKEFITKIHKNGDAFGYTVAFTNNSYFDSCVALEESEVYKIPKKDFLEIISSSRSIAGKFMRMLSDNVENQENQLLSLAYDSVRKRTAEVLLILLNSFNSQNIERRITVSREDLAGLSGTAVETVIRCLSEFKEDELIMTKGRDIIILDEVGLSQI